MRVGLMVEGQAGLTWERWRHILALAERLGFPSLFRSDHYMITHWRDSLEAYLSFVLAAEVTSSLRFGPMVSPVTFRSPADVARMAGQIQLLSGGRFVLGLGAGWNAEEHAAYGISFPPLRERMGRLEEALRLIPALWQPGPTTYAGRYYRVEQAECLPLPEPPPPILIGGSGPKRTLRLAARYADEWNSVYLGPALYAERARALEQHCTDVDRDPATIRRSMMLFALVGPTPTHVEAVTRTVMAFQALDGDPAAFQQEQAATGMIVGGREELVETLGQLAESGLEEVMLQHFHFDDDEIPTWYAEEIAPAVAHL